jgi:hypothetical protein
MLDIVEINRLQDGGVFLLPAMPVGLEAKTMTGPHSLGGRLHRQKQNKALTNKT